MQVRKLRYYCHKVLPLVYDDSLSYYELLCKVVEKINELIDNPTDIQIADPPQWNITSQYPMNTIVFDYDGTAYIAKQPVPSGVDIDNTDYWGVIFNYNDNINDLRRQIAYNAEDSNTTEIALNANDLVFWKGIIYKVLVNMPAGTAFIEDVNIEEYTVDKKINDTYNLISNVDDEISELETNVANDFNNLREQITYNENGNTTTKHLYPNDLVFWKGELYKVISNMPEGTAFVEDVNIEHTDLESVINNISTSAGIYANIKEYGGIGDGETDDTQAFIRAYNAKHAVYFPTGTYIIDDAELTGDVLIYSNNATVKSIDAGNGQPGRVFRFNNCRCIINNLRFEGLGIPSGVIEDTPDFLLAENSDLYFINSTFVNIRTLDYNNPAENWWERHAVVLRAIDCDNIVFNNCSFKNVAGNEILYIIPHNKARNTSRIIFDNNLFEDSNGMSFDFFGGYVSVQNNYFKNWKYIGSCMNICGDDVYIKNNSFYDCSFGSVFDTCEGGYWACGNVWIENNSIEASGTTFIINDSKNLYVKNNDVTCGIFLLDVNITKTLAQSVGMPEAIRNTTRFEGGSHNIENNNIIINFGTNTPSYIIRIWGIGVFAGVDDVENSTALNNAIISNNMIKYNSVINADKTVPILWNNYIENCSITNNTIDNVPSSTDISTAPYVIGMAQNYSRVAKSLRIGNNTLIRSGVPFIRWFTKQYYSSSGTPAIVVAGILIDKNEIIGSREQFFSPNEQKVLSHNFNINNLQQPVEMVSDTTFWDYLSNNMNEGETRIFAFYNMTFKTVTAGIAIAVRNYDLSTNSFRVLVFSGETILSGTVTVNGIN